MSSASSIRLREDDDAPGCLPGLRSDLLRDERFFAGFFDHGASDDGGREEFDESEANTRSNSSCPTRNAAFSVRKSAFSARNAAFSAASCPSGGARSGTTTPCLTPAKINSTRGDHAH